MAFIFIPNHLYPTPSASGKNTRYTSCTPSYNKRQTFTSIHSIAKTLKKASRNFSVCLYYITQLLILCYCTFYIYSHYEFFLQKVTKSFCPHDIIQSIPSCFLHKIWTNQRQITPSIPHFPVPAH